MNKKQHDTFEMSELIKSKIVGPHETLMMLRKQHQRRAIVKNIMRVVSIALVVAFASWCFASVLHGDLLFVPQLLGPAY